MKTKVGNDLILVRDYTHSGLREWAITIIEGVLFALMCIALTVLFYVLGANPISV